MKTFLRELAYFAIVFFKMLFWTILAITSIGMAGLSTFWVLLTQDNRFMGFTVLGVLLALKFTINMLSVK